MCEMLAQPANLTPRLLLLLLLLLLVPCRSAFSSDFPPEDFGMEFLTKLACWPEIAHLPQPRLLIGKAVLSLLLLLLLLLSGILNTQGIFCHSLIIGQERERERGSS